MLCHALALLVATLVSGALPAKPAAEPAPQVLPGEGRACPLPGGYRFTYRFASRPTLGTDVLKVQLFGPDGKRSTALRITARWDMPAMPMRRDLPEEAFQLSRKGDYLLPTDFSMPGDWELLLSFYNGQKRVYRARIQVAL